MSNGAAGEGDRKRDSAAGVPQAWVGKTLASVTSPPPIRAARGLSRLSNKPKHEDRMSEQRGSSGSKRRRRCGRECAPCLSSVRRFRPSIPISLSLPRDRPQRPRRRATCRSGSMGRHGADRDAGAGAIRFAPIAATGSRWSATGHASARRSPPCPSVPATFFSPPRAPAAASTISTLPTIRLISRSPAPGVST